MTRLRAYWPAPRRLRLAHASLLSKLSLKTILCKWSLYPYLHSDFTDCTSHFVGGEWKMFSISYCVAAPRQFWRLVMIIFWRRLVDNNFQFSTLSVKLVVPHCRICVILCPPTWARPGNGEIKRTSDIFLSHLTLALKFLYFDLPSRFLRA